MQRALAVGHHVEFAALGILVNLGDQGRSCSSRRFSLILVNAAYSVPPCRIKRLLPLSLLCQWAVFQLSGLLCVHTVIEK